ncbi:MAG TPA: lysylphosphatidylglycerol synthase transmembrane domain-containing protein [Gammaproteobacteria bacterium]|nr:lysylphosphatidylglycerol synthase transmembrane domain-containing protein [Gammaproteobacteria bacterium]
MTVFRLLYLAMGLTLLGYILSDAELEEVWRQTLAFGFSGISVIIALYAVEFLADVAGWQIAFSTLRFDGAWLRRLYLVRMVGEAFNVITPMASMGGEPVKVVLLKKYYGVPYADASAAVLLAKTTNLISLVFFLAGGFALMLLDPRFSTAEFLVAGAGLIILFLVVSCFFLVQRTRVSSRTSAWLSGWRVGQRIGDYLHHIEAFDARLVNFYTRRKRRFTAALILALCAWYIGALSVYYTMVFLGTPVSFTDAWIIEAFAQLVRAGTFFIPASIGAQEGAFVLVCATLTGSASSGLAVALVRRFRELVWIGGGLLLGWWFSFRSAARVGAAKPENKAHAPTSGET